MTISVEKQIVKQEIQELNRIFEVDMEWSFDDCLDAWLREVKIKREADEDHPTTLVEHETLDEKSGLMIRRISTLTKYLSLSDKEIIAQHERLQKLISDSRTRWRNEYTESREWLDIMERKIRTVRHVLNRELDELDELWRQRNDSERPLNMVPIGHRLMS